MLEELTREETASRKGDHTAGALSAVVLLVRNAWWIAGVTVIVLSVVVAEYAMNRRWVASSTFQPQVAGQSRITGIAAQLGLAMPDAGSTESVKFYADLVKTEQLLAAAATTEYTIENEDGESLHGTAVSLLEIEGDTDNDRLRRTIGVLHESVNTRIDIETNVVTLETSAGNPDLALALNRRILELVNVFNLERRQTRATAELGFVAARLEDVRSELSSAEDSLELFFERNRSYQSSPQLVFEAARLQREVDVKQQVYSTLAVSVEQARIERVRNTPIVSIIDSPDGSVRPVRSLIGRVLFGTLVGLAIGIIMTFVREYWSLLKRTHPDEWRELRTALRRAVGRPAVT